MLTLLLSVLLVPHVSVPLQVPFREAVQEWGGLLAPVRNVRYCAGAECDAPYGGGAWVLGNGACDIFIQPDFPFPGGPAGLLNTLAHEYGHALGLLHVPRSLRVSVMAEGWLEPYSPIPTPADIAAAGAAQPLLAQLTYCWGHK